MAAYPFFSPGSGDPTRSLRRIIRQTANNVPGLHGSAVDFYHNGGPMGLEREAIERMAILGGSVRGTPITSKLNVTGMGPLYMGDLDAGSRAQAALFLSHFQGYLTTNPGSGAHYRHRIGDHLRASPGTQQLNKLTMLGDDDKGYATRVVDVVPNGFNLSIASRANVALDFPVFPGAADLWADAVEGVGNTGTISATTLPVLRGCAWNAHFPATQSTDTDIIVTITADDETTVSFTVKMGAAGTASSAQTATKGVWTRLYYSEDDLKLGTRGNWVSIYFHGGSADGEYVTGDTFTFDARRAVWTPAFDTEVVIPEINCTFYIDGEEIPMDGGIQIAASQDTVETRYVAGGEQPVGTYRAGYKTVNINVSRRYVDLTLERKLLNASVVSFVAEGYSDVEIGSTGQDYGVAFVAPSCRVTGTTFSTDQGGTNRDEALVLQARMPDPDLDFDWDGETVEGDFEVIFDTDFAAIP